MEASHKARSWKDDVHGGVLMVHKMTKLNDHILQWAIKPRNILQIHSVCRQRTKKEL